MKKPYCCGWHLVAFTDITHPLMEVFTISLCRSPFWRLRMCGLDNFWKYAIAKDREVVLRFSVCLGKVPHIQCYGINGVKVVDYVNARSPYFLLKLILAGAVKGTLSMFWKSSMEQSFQHHSLVVKFLLQPGIIKQRGADSWMKTTFNCLFLC